MYGRGGPSFVDKTNMGLDTICDRSKADVRGVKISSKKKKDQKEKNSMVKNFKSNLRIHKGIL